MSPRLPQYRDPISATSGEPVPAGTDDMRGITERLIWYRLRDAGRPDSVYGDQITNVDQAFQRALSLAGFYQRPIEVRRVVMGRLERPVGQPVMPGPTAPIR